jgi:hypothetical protein
MRLDSVLLFDPARHFIGGVPRGLVPDQKDLALSLPEDGFEILDRVVRAALLVGPDVG